MIFTSQERVHLPWQDPFGNPIQGTISAVEARRFRVSWDSHGRKPGQPRLSRWYPAYMAARFRRGNAAGRS
jgi:hypothetical protein